MVRFLWNHDALEFNVAPGQQLPTPAPESLAYRAQLSDGRMVRVRVRLMDMPGVTALVKEETNGRT